MPKTLAIMYTIDLDGNKGTPKACAILCTTDGKIGTPQVAAEWYTTDGKIGTPQVAAEWYTTDGKIGTPKVSAEQYTIVGNQDVLGLRPNHNPSLTEKRKTRDEMIKVVITT